ncbi:cupin domain-containing protein [Pseudohongiella sp.]|uniref:JmjC domain-containing protein n=1 Tax=marine sediment metagenome TaxID=412755 RepID=A0A0F9W2N6_9ZZZZ|nr:cupin domain-containing protein [Pseudohongiella sp.]HDZ09827.1 cupin domain-containing protein [Pseudohongiella sp.]HEA61559.1 cupin domain-containing protein [Pseudohongiella sp.]
MIESVLPAEFDRQLFLRDYWQKKPLLIRAGELPFVDPITPEELAGLACEQEVESRLIQVNSAQDSWQLRTGPFTEAEFESLPQTHYSLLVQAVDHWTDEVSALLADFDFIPSWRIDDVMVSYATDGGNVGPHFDYYDVFLIQGMGQKRWQTGAMCNSMTPRRDESGLRLLQDFQAEQEWIVNPGDILYLPPGVSHYGVAIGNSMTYSVGFRAPSHADIASGLADEILDDLTEDQRFVDVKPGIPLHPGEISPEVVRHLRELVMGMIDRPELMRQWFGKTMTTPKYATEDAPSCCEHEDGHDHNHADISDIISLRAALDAGAEVFKVPGSRYAYALDSSHAELFVDGECYHCNWRLLTLLQALSAPGYTEALDPDVVAACNADEEAAQLLLTLYNRGSLIIG